MTKYQVVPQARLVRVAAALAIIFGVLGMHGWSFHGTAHAGTPEIGTRAHSTLPNLRQVHPEHAFGDAGIPPASQSGTAETSPVVSTATPDSGGTGHTLRDMAMLCLATLATAATLLAMMRCLRRGRRMWAVLHVVVRHLSCRGPTARGTGPPHVWRFSVIRC